MGELGSAMVLVSGLAKCVSDSSSYNRNSGCSDSGAITLGLVGYLVFRIWEVVDVWVTPPDHNRRYRKLKKRLGEDPDEEALSIMVMPVAQNNFGLGLQFRF